MTASRRDRLRKVQKIVSNLEDVVRAADFEQPLGDEIKMERVFGAAGKMIRFARVSLHEHENENELDLCADELGA